MQTKKTSNEVYKKCLLRYWMPFYISKLKMLITKNYFKLKNESMPRYFAFLPSSSSMRKS